LRLLAMARHVASTRLVPQANRLGLASHSQAESALVVRKRPRMLPTRLFRSNDFSARDLQLELPSGQWMIGKTLDNFAPIGPYFVSSDLVGDPNKLKIETRVNGELRQSSNTSDFIFNTQQMVSYISKHWTLEPGDIIFTGTPKGVIAGHPKDKQVWLKPGDEVVSTIEKLGELKFTLA
jgi:2-keto-4-pentenoate hydratase/2-oxohepta-3-ene-1,7-dioic acid hydratase in catechol pathway